MEFHVESCKETKVFKTWEEASIYAFNLAASGRADVVLDVIIYDKEGAMTYGGNDGVERYLDDPDASVFERFEIKVNCLGMIS